MPNADEAFFVKNKKIMILKSTLALALVVVCLPVLAVPTDKLNLSVGLSFENTDNISLSSVNKVSESIIHTLMSVDYKKESAVINTHFNLSGDYTDYQKNVYPDQAVFSSLFGLTSTLIHRRLFLDIENRFDRVQSNYNAANVPTNQENTNSFTAGPKLVIFQNDKQSLNANVKYENFYTEKTNSDYTGYIMNTAYIRNVTRTFSMGLVANYNDRSFRDKVTNTDYARTDYTVNITKRTKFSQMGLDFGKTLVTSGKYPGDEQSIFRANYKYTFGEKTVLNLSSRRELGDFAGVFSGGTTVGGNLPIVGSSLFLIKEEQLNVMHNFGTSSISFGYTYFSNDYTDDVLDLITNTSQLTFTHRITPTINLNLSGTYIKTEFPGLIRDDSEKIYRLGISKNFIDTYDITFNVQYTNQGSTDSNFVYNERRVSLAGHYYFR